MDTYENGRNTVLRSGPAYSRFRQSPASADPVATSRVRRGLRGRRRMSFSRPCSNRPETLMNPWPKPDPAGPGQESVWDYPRPPRLEDFTGSISIELGG